jgi:lysophospholipase L1-like esterase
MSYTRWTRSFGLTTCLLIAFLFHGCFGERETTKESVRYASAIEAFLKEDQTAPPEQGTILFVGSSIFRQWKQHMAPLPVFNRAFGGSRTADILTHMDAIVLPYNPKIIVYYCGSNDINASEQPLDIAKRFKAFWWRVSAKLPEVRLFYVSINRAPQKQAKWNVVDSTNALVKDFCRVDARLDFIDVNPVLFDTAGKPRYELYQDDLLHLRTEAYEMMTTIIKPLLTATWSGVR